ncbi:hypothetical protein MACA111363_11160 [Macrococcoides canis]|uniref:Uncharacterized protein n=1 Tax=Macrococcoides canis TaxID=1855823 RepID=A0A1W7ACI4_9STAP|nr:hypothetical protein MCCS_16570 [Macrococcus canis]
MKRMYPRECYKSWFHYLLKIPSPIKIMAYEYNQIKKVEMDILKSLYDLNRQSRD